MDVSTSDEASSPRIKNDIPTDNKHSVVTPESNMNRNELWLKVSQFAEKTQGNSKQIHENNLRLPELINLPNTNIQNLQEGYANLMKASKETNKRLKQILKEQ
ncbi:hypothetical protein O181_038793 [Austropuccinia psidii MF-1]|uniref:Uncharacterized protein n=1 Tax=Austropuccinia psidii MF-1 TaxID=1389203 RepID=A0A9Q3DE30_9BASI|nr:hypothetical protein [Austropuccinia psidii MF-1]